MYRNPPGAIHVCKNVYTKTPKAIHVLPDFDVRYAANAGDKLPPLQTVGTPIAGEP